ncbi:MAG: glycosyl hydrolase [Bacteroidota bacterium]
MTIDEIRPMLVNVNATDETAAMFFNLLQVKETGFIVGHHDSYAKFYEENSNVSDFVTSTGSHPGLLGSDFMFISDDQNDGKPGNWYFEQELKIKKHVTEAYQNGLINTFAWHFRDPFEGKEFDAKHMNPDHLKAAVASILPNGENHEYYREKLRKIAEVAGSLIGEEGEAIPIIFRPFHEFDGDWFWWGKSNCTPDQYIELWRFTVHYLSYELGVNNLLFAYSPDNKFSSESEYLERYPGDDYVDILAMDNYEDFRRQKKSGFKSARKKLQIISELAIARNKIAALSETGFNLTGGLEVRDNFYSKHLMMVLADDDVKLSYIMFWSNKPGEYFVPLPGHDAHLDFIAFIERVKGMMTIKNIYKLDFTKMA